MNRKLQNTLISAGILISATLMSVLFEHLGFTDANIIMVYILGVVITSVVTSQRIYSLVSSIGSVVIFNFLFTTPRYSLTAYGAGYPVTFLVMFFTAYITGTLALENKANLREKEEAAMMAKNEQLRANLLREISHDLRTPLTSISGNASNLLENGDRFSRAEKQRIYTDIYQDSMWLIKLVENLLYATRIEDGRMTLSRLPELVSEMISEVMKRAEHQRGGHVITAVCPDDLLMIRGDANLLVLVLLNLVDNAVKYTPSDCEIVVSAKREGDRAVICVSDTGGGIPDEEKEKVFEKFYTGQNSGFDHRRSLGLGLYLCRAIIEAHDGSITVRDNDPHGAVFVISLPVEEVPHYE